MNFCSSFQCRIANPFVYEPDTAFLGEGTFGRVFRVIPNNISDNQAKGIDFQAMKVCRLEHINIIQTEHAALARHAEQCGCDLLVKPVGNSIIVRSDLNLCGYVMQPVGER